MQGALDVVLPAVIGWLPGYLGVGLLTAAILSWGWRTMYRQAAPIAGLLGAVAAWPVYWVWIAVELRNLVRELSRGTGGDAPLPAPAPARTREDLMRARRRFN